MEALVTFLEGSVQTFSPKEAVADPTSKWTKNVLFTQFKTESDNHRETLKLEVLNLLTPVIKERFVPRQIYLMSLLEAEVGFLVLYAKKFLAVLEVGPRQLGDTVDDVGVVRLITEWNNLRKYNQKLRILLKYFEGVLGLACLQTILAVDPSEFPSHHSAQVLWKSCGEHDQFQIEFKELVKALEDEYDLPLEKCLELLRSHFSTKHQIATVFRLDAASKKGVHSTILQLALQVGKKEGSGAHTPKSGDAGEITPEISVVSKLADREELRRIQRDVSRKMTNVEETMDNLEYNKQQLLLALNDVEPFFANSAKDTIKKDFKARNGKQEEELVALRRVYKAIIDRVTELDEAERKQRLLAGEEDDDPEVGLSMSGVGDFPDSSLATATGRTSAPSSNRASLLVPLASDRRPSANSLEGYSSSGSLDRKVSSNSLSSSSSTGKISKEEVEPTLAKILGKLRVTPELMAKWAAQNNFADRFGLSSSEKLYWYTTGAHCIGVVTFPGTLYVYENHICFQRTLRPEVDKVTHPMSSVLRVLKALSPPFFDNGLQVQLKDKKTSFHFGYLDNRDLLWNLIQTLVVKAEKGQSSESALIDMGYMAVESIYENQRYAFLKGYSVQGLLVLDACGPWSNEEGKPKQKSDIHLPNSYWQWTSPWVVDKGGHVDAEGWEYAMNWTTQWGQKLPTSLVRRRKWVRPRMKLPQPLTSDHLVQTLTGNVPESRRITIYDADGTFSGFYLL